MNAIRSTPKGVTTTDTQQADWPNLTAQSNYSDEKAGDDGVSSLFGGARSEPIGRMICFQYMRSTAPDQVLRLWATLCDAIDHKDLLGHLSMLRGEWGAIRHLWGKFRYRGMYEILEYDSTLEILDIGGEKAKLTRREGIRFLQDNVVAIHDHAWGDGRFLCDYRCQPGVAVDIYESGAKHNILISLRETKNRGDEMELWVERTIKGGFVEDEEV